MTVALPAIAPYALPAEADLPDNRVDWHPDPGRAALLVHDMQNYFVGAYRTDAEPVRSLVRNIAELVGTARGLGMPVIYSAQPGGQTDEQRGLLRDFWGDGIDDGPYQRRIIEPLTPAEGDVLLTKWRYSAFHDTPLRELLAERGRDQLIVCGIYAHIGCLMTACDAFMQDLQAFLVADAVADFSADEHRMALRYAAGRCAVTITTARLTDRLATAPAGTP